MFCFCLHFFECVFDSFHAKKANDVVWRIISWNSILKGIRIFLNASFTDGYHEVLNEMHDEIFQKYNNFLLITLSGMILNRKSDYLGKEKRFIKGICRKLWHDELWNASKLQSFEIYETEKGENSNNCNSSNYAVMIITTVYNSRWIHFFIFCLHTALVTRPSQFF